MESFQFSMYTLTTINSPFNISFIMFQYVVSSFSLNSRKHSSSLLVFTPYSISRELCSFHELASVLSFLFFLISTLIGGDLIGYRELFQFSSIKSCFVSEYVFSFGESSPRY